MIIITGAATGLGLATALRLAREGAWLSLVDLDAERLKEADVKDYVERTHRHFGRIDGLYNNAGIEGKQNPVEDYDSQVFDRVIDIS